MAKEDLIEMSGQVLEVLPDARYKVKLDNGHELIAYTNGKIKRQDAQAPYSHSRRRSRFA